MKVKRALISGINKDNESILDAISGKYGYGASVDRVDLCECRIDNLDDEGENDFKHLVFDLMAYGFTVQVSSEQP